MLSDKITISAKKTSFLQAHRLILMLVTAGANVDCEDHKLQQ